MGALPGSPRRGEGELSLLQLLPNLITITAIVAGLTAIRFGIQGNYELSAQLIVLAALLDGIDGRIARALKSDSRLGAELDSLADFLNFGVAPPLVVYFWVLQDAPSAGWLAVLVFSVCCVLRLARFNVWNKAGPGRDELWFVGVPAPAGALLVMLPMFLSFAIAEAPDLPPGPVAAYMVLIGLALISRLRTPSLRQVRIARGRVRYVIVALAFVGAALMTYPWVTLALLCLAYVAAVLAGLFRHRRRGEGR